MNKLASYLGIFLMIFVFESCTQKTRNSNVTLSGVEGKPNVILIITDDQGFGDLGCNGNPHVKTPNIDNFAKESVRFDEFLVSPVCAPTRSSIMTGRYTLRTGVRDTYRGGAIMAASEVTIAEVLKDAGYKTGMIGKWHLGDNYPSRPEDQGFDYTLRHLSGGIGQPGDFPNALEGDSSYFDPILWKNGERIQSTGYCSDVFGEAAVDFVAENHDQPFFLYLAFNAPHAPLQVPQEYYDMYKDIDPAAGFENDERPFPDMTDIEKENARKVYGMVSNIDDNLGRLFQKLDELQLKENTLVIFMTDNGPQHRRYIAGMRGLKSSVFEGGVRVPSFWRLPALFSGDRDVLNPAAHYDILPTIADICGAKIPEDRKIDGQSLVPLLKNEKTELPERFISRTWNRHSPVKYHNVSTRNNGYKLVGTGKTTEGLDNFELFNIKEDPFELNKIGENNSEKVSELKMEMDAWFDEMVTAPNFVNSPRAIIGTEFENPTMLNLNDATFIKRDGFKTEVATWEVEVAKAGKYDVIVHFTNTIKTDCEIELQLGATTLVFNFSAPDSEQLKIERVELPEGEVDIVPIIWLKDAGNKELKRPFYLEVNQK
jgi:arylsulfatase